MALYRSGRGSPWTVALSDRLSVRTSLTLVSPTAIVEQVKDGSTLRVRLLMPDGEHQFINLALAGVRCARAASKQGEPSEPWGEEVSDCRTTVR